MAMTMAARCWRVISCVYISVLFGVSVNGHYLSVEAANCCLPIAERLYLTTTTTGDDYFSRVVDEVPYISHAHQRQPFAEVESDVV